MGDHQETDGSNIAAAAALAALVGSFDPADWIRVGSSGRALSYEHRSDGFLARMVPWTDQAHTDSLWSLRQAKALSDSGAPVLLPAHAAPVKISRQDPDGKAEQSEASWCVELWPNSDRSEQCPPDVFAGLLERLHSTPPPPDVPHIYGWSNVAAESEASSGLSTTVLPMWCSVIYGRIRRHLRNTEGRSGGGDIGRLREVVNKRLLADLHHAETLTDRASACHGAPDPVNAVRWQGEWQLINVGLSGRFGAEADVGLWSMLERRGLPFPKAVADNYTRQVSADRVKAAEQLWELYSLARLGDLADEVPAAVDELQHRMDTLRDPDVAWHPVDAHGLVASDAE